MAKRAMVKPHTSGQPAGVFDLFKRSYGLVKENLNVFIFVYSASALFALWNFLNWFTDDKTTFTEDSVSFSGWFSSFSGLNADIPAGTAGILTVLIVAAAVFFGLLQVILTTRVAQGRQPDLGDVWAEFKKSAFKLFLLQIVLGIMIIIGFILLIVPGIILLWRLSMAPYVMLDTGAGIDESIRKSWRMTRNYAGPIYAVILLGLALALTGILPYVGPIVSFLLAVAFSCVLPLRYWEIKRLA